MDRETGYAPMDRFRNVPPLVRWWPEAPMVGGRHSQDLDRKESHHARR